VCGLVIIYRYRENGAPVDGPELLAVCRALVARGPDGCGAWFDAACRVALGHRRLAIIDPDPRADQPMSSPCGRWHLVYNGEIYNWRELRAELEAEGVTFRTRSDTEVLLHWFARRGVEGLARLRGMYAFAFWDEVERRLWLARDPFGIKPLYWHDDGRTVRAASQVRALLAGGAIADEPEPAGIVGFLLWGSVPEPWTTVRGIRALPAGHVLEVGPKGVGGPRPFVELASSLREWEQVPEPVAAEAVEAFTESMRAHLEADVPVGLFLSSGIDSCALLAVLARIGRAPETLAVTLGFAEFAGRPEDEVPLAARLARTYGVRHVVRRVELTEFREDLPRFLEAMDQPTVDGLNTWFVAKAAREQGLKVALSGLGGDELLGGYPSFRRIPRIRRVTRYMRGLPGTPLLWRMGADLARRAGLPLHPKLAGLVEYGRDDFGAFRLVRGLYLPRELTGWLEPDFVREGLERLSEEQMAARELAQGPESVFARVSLLEASRYMRHQLLRDTDWASMAHSLEVRVPFVDLPLWRVLHPWARYNRGKAAFAAALGLPGDLVRRPKTGFMTPIASWLEDLVGPAPAGRRPDEPWSRRWARWLLTQDVTSLPGTDALPLRQGSPAHGPAGVSTRARVASC